jgi:hypothetical protein
MKLVRIVGPTEEGSRKEALFTQVQLVAESTCRKMCDYTNNLEKPGYPPMVQEMTLYIFNNPRWIWPQEDSFDQQGKPRECMTPSYGRKWENRTYLD